MPAASYGKKIGKLVVKLDGQYSGERVTFDLRYQSDKFTVIHEGEAYTANTERELKRMMVELLRSQRQIVWTKYIIPEYESEALRVRHSRGGSQIIRRSLEQAAPDLVRGISLDWEIVEYSQERRDGDGEPFYLYRDHEGDSPLRATELPSDAIVFTPERLAALEQIRFALTSLDRKMRGFLGVGSEAIAAALDRGFASTSLPALPAPEPAPHAATCRSLQPVGVCDYECEDIENDAIKHHYNCDAAPEACDCGKDKESGRW